MTADAFDTKVKAAIPEATNYSHVHFGVWASLGDAAKSGAQNLSDLGIGFVQNYSDGGLTPIGGTSDDMPNHGSAEYNGNWVAAIQAEDEDGNGAISLTSGAATLKADFEMATISAELDTLATLSGDIDGNTFSGTEAEDIVHTSLDDEAKFIGDFSGGFYGKAADEAAGVFDFASKDNEGGAFRGAFGGHKE